MKNTTMAAAAQNANIRNFKNNTEAIDASIHSTRWLVKKAKEAILANMDGEIIDHCEYTIGDRHYSIYVEVCLIQGYLTYWGLRVRDNVTGNETLAGVFRRDSLRFDPSRGYKYAVACAVSSMNNWKPKTSNETVNNNNYELVDNGQFPYGYQCLEDSELHNEIADQIKDHLFWGEDCEDCFVVYEGDNGDYTFDYTFDWIHNELTYQITNEDGYCESFTDDDYDLGMYDRIDSMMEWLEEHLLEIDRREWEKNN